MKTLFFLYYGILMYGVFICIYSVYKVLLCIFHSEEQITQNTGFSRG